MIHTEFAKRHGFTRSKKSTANRLPMSYGLAQVIGSASDR